MDSNAITFTVNGNTESVRLTEKGYGVWQPICHSDKMQYGQCRKKRTERLTPPHQNT